MTSAPPPPLGTEVSGPCTWPVHWPTFCDCFTDQGHVPVAFPGPVGAVPLSAAPRASHCRARCSQPHCRSVRSKCPGAAYVLIDRCDKVSARFIPVLLCSALVVFLFSSWNHFPDWFCFASICLHISVPFFFLTAFVLLVLSFFDSNLIPSHPISAHLIPFHPTLAHPISSHSHSTLPVPNSYHSVSHLLPSPPSLHLPSRSPSPSRFPSPPIPRRPVPYPYSSVRERFRVGTAGR